MFKEQDRDSSNGLSMLEFGKAMEEWGMSCSAMHRSYFCSGSTQIHCCKSGPTWRECGHVGHHHNCMGGGGSSYGQHGSSAFGGSYGGGGYHHHGWR
mmetsp:Transcript_39391/g.125030  ORF Transcript_39391/g.125030 Transcript_39391/m.125030 type:complete len:97 (-) Transcript_39391:71-361(-)